MKLYASGYVAEVGTKSFFPSAKSLLKSASLSNVFGSSRYSQGDVRRC